MVEQPMPEPTRHRAGKWTSIEKTKIVVCEGIEDVLVFSGLLDNYPFPANLRDCGQNFQFFECGGKGNLEDFLENELPPIPGWHRVTSLAVILDATGDPSGFQPNFEKARNAIQRIKSPIFAVPSEAGQPALHDGRKSAIWVLPDNSSLGQLEDLCLEANKQHPLMPCVDNIEACVVKLKGQVCNTSKARLNTLLAWDDVHHQRRLGEIRDTFIKQWDLNVFRPIVDDFFLQL